MRLSKEILGQIEGKKPRLDSKEKVVFAEWEASGEDIDGAILIEVDKENGRPLKVWFYKGGDYEDFYDEEGYRSGIIPKSFKLNDVTELKYQPLVYSHSILDRQIEAEFQEVRSWQADKLGRKRERLEARRLLIVFEDSWDPSSERPRGFQVLEERGYESREPTRRISVSEKEQWIEKYRTFLFSNATIAYVRNTDGLMVIWHSNIETPIKYSGIDYPKDLKPPLEVGEATFIDF